MSRARLRVLIAIAAVFAAAAALVLALAGTVAGARLAPPEHSGRRLLLLTSLPLVFGEQFSLQDGGSPALKALRDPLSRGADQRHRPAELGKGGCC